jgi:hypothetical protein
MMIFSELPGKRQTTFGSFRSFYWLFGKMLVVTAGLGKYFFERGLSLLIVAAVFLQASQDDFA